MQILIYTTSFIVYNIWFGATLALYLAKAWKMQDGSLLTLARRIFRETKPFVLPAIALMLFTDTHSMSGRVIDFAVSLYIWFNFKDIDKDDNWKRRLEKLKSKVAIQESKLVIIPSEA